MGIAAIFTYLYGNYEFGIKPFIYTVIGGLIISFALLCKGIALTKTLAGPVQAIQLKLLINLFLFNRIYNWKLIQNEY